MTTFTSKTFQVWIDASPTGPRPTWIECYEPILSGKLDGSEIPYLEAKLEVTIPLGGLPAGVPYAAVDARKRTRVRIEASTPAGVSLPYCYIRSATRHPDDPARFTLQLVSEDGLLLEPGNPSSMVVSWRQYTRLNTLIPAVCAQAGLTLAPGASIPNHRCDPIYEKRNLIINPNGLPGATIGSAPPETPRAWWGTGYSSTSPAPPRMTAAGGVLEWWCHQPTLPMDVEPGKEYRFTIVVTVPAGSWLIGKPIHLVMKSYQYPNLASSEVWYSASFILAEGAQRVDQVFTVPESHVGKVAVGGEVTHGSIPNGTWLNVQYAGLYRVDPGDGYGEYFSANTPDNADYLYRWAGFPANSESVRYPVTPRALEVALQEPGESLWSVIAPHMARHGLRLIPTPGQPGQWQVAGPPTGSTSSRTTLTTNDDRYLTEELVTDRADDAFADAVVLHYRWQSLGEPREAWDDASIPAPTKVKVVELDDVPYPGPGAAAQYLRVARQRGRRVTLTFPLDLWPRPRDLVRLGGPGSSDPHAGYFEIERIEFDSESDEMTVTAIPDPTHAPDW